MSRPTHLNIDTLATAARSMPSPTSGSPPCPPTEFDLTASQSSSSRGNGPLTPPWQEDGSAPFSDMNRSSTSSSTAPVPILPAIRHPLWRLECNSCSASLCEQAMQGHLVGDPSKKLFSTNQATGVLGLPDRPVSIICPCKFHLFACASCGSVCGYNLSQPCAGCETNRGNGHFWIFYAHEIVAHWRTKTVNEQTGEKRNMFWDDLPPSGNLIKSFINVGR